MGGVDGPDDTVGLADGGEVAGGQGLWRRAVAPVDHDRAGRGGEVGGGRRLVGVDEGPEQDGARRVPLNSRDRVAGRAGQPASMTVAVPGVKGVGPLSSVLTLILTVKVPSLGVGVAAEDIEDRVAVGRIDADLLDRQRDGRARGVPSPQPPIGRIACSLATVARVLGSSKVASTIVPVLWASTAPKLCTAPVTGRSVTVKVALSVSSRRRRRRRWW